MANMKPENDLSTLRSEIRQIDEAILKLAAQRQELARRVGEAKLAHNLPIKDFKVEKEVIGNHRARARELGFYEDMGEEIARLLIKYSCWVQEEYKGRARSRSSATQKRVLVAGGLGLMGQWMARFFESFGHAVTLLDVKQGGSGAEAPFPIAQDPVAAAQNAEVIVLATPIAATASVIELLAATKTKALVFDICSLKSPLLSTIELARKNGLRITSVHPMFGPSVQYLAGRNILLCDTGDAALTDEAALLFKECTANLVRVPLTKHDEFMGYILGLSHLTSLVFADTLTRGGLPYAALKGVGSTTFTTQAGVTEAVVAENQDLYYEIQAENGFTGKVLEGMKRSLDEYAGAIGAKDRAAFKALMERSRKYFSSMT